MIFEGEGTARSRESNRPPLRELKLQRRVDICGPSHALRSQYPTPYRNKRRTNAFFCAGPQTCGQPARGRGFNKLKMQSLSAARDKPMQRFKTELPSPPRAPRGKRHIQACVQSGLAAPRARHLGRARRRRAATTRTITSARLLQR